MYARVVKTTNKPGTVEEATKIYQDSVVPAAKSVDGYKGGYLLVDSENNKAISIALYESLEQLKASAESGYLQEQFAKFGEVFAAPPETETYEVAIKI
jgi:quinol monooxygenase YgiN